jgi:hypothetical protein
MANPITSPSLTVEGVWLIPTLAGQVQETRKVFIEADSTPMTMPPMADVFDPPSRKVKIGHLATAKQFEGTIAGDITTAHGISAATWADRLRTLHRDQGEYTIQLVTPHFAFGSVLLSDGFTLDPYNSATPFFRVSLPFISIEE